VIVQPYVPQYRVPFFDSLVTRLLDNNIDCRVLAGRPAGAQAARGDSGTADWLVQVEGRTHKIAGRSVQSIGNSREWLTANGVIVGLAATSPDSYRAIVAGRLRKNLRVGVWGHGRSYVTKGTPVDDYLRTRQMKSADQVFAYTPSGASYVVDRGVNASRVTTVMNTIDTRGLVQAADAITDAEVLDFTATHGLVKGKTLAFIGGLDETKRIRFLSQTLDLLWDLDPEIRLIVGGRGAEEELLAPSAARGQTIQLGFVGNREKALIGATASAIVMPGRIGLVAVESLTLNVPILTTTWPYHAPEFDYLTEGESVYSFGNDVQTYSARIGQFLRTKRPSASTWAYPTLDGMVTNFANGVQSMLA